MPHYEQAKLDCLQPQALVSNKFRKKRNLNETTTYMSKKTTTHPGGIPQTLKNLVVKEILSCLYVDTDNGPTAMEHFAA